MGERSKEWYDTAWIWIYMNKRNPCYGLHRTIGVAWSIAQTSCHKGRKSFCRLVAEKNATKMAETEKNFISVWVFCMEIVVNFEISSPFSRIQARNIKTLTNTFSFQFPHEKSFTSSSTTLQYHICKCLLFFIGKFSMSLVQSIVSTGSILVQSYRCHLSWVVKKSEITSSTATMTTTTTWQRNVGWFASRWA